MRTAGVLKQIDSKLVEERITPKLPILEQRIIDVVNPVDLQQIKFIFSILVIGLLLSTVILIFEISKGIRNARRRLNN